MFQEAGIDETELTDAESSQLIYQVCKGIMSKTVPVAPPVPAPARNRSATVAVTAPSSSASLDAPQARVRSNSAEQKEPMADLVSLLKAGVKLKPVKVEKDDYTVMDVRQITSEKRLSMISTLKAVMEHRRARTGPLIDSISEDEYSDESSYNSDDD